MSNLHAALARLQHLLLDRALLGGRRIGERPERMREHIAWPQPLQHLLVARRRMVDVAHQRHAGFVRHLQRNVERHRARVAGSAAPDAHLDADDHVAIGIGHLHRADRVHQPQLLALTDHDAVGEGVDAGMRHVQVGQDAHLARLDHMLAEAGEIAGTGAARIDCSRHARGAAELLCIDPERGGAPVDVGVQVDQAGRYDHPDTSRTWSRGRPPARAERCGHLAACESHIGNGIELLRRVDHPPAAKKAVADAAESGIGTSERLRHSASERGQVVVIFALLVPVLLAMGGAVIGIGNWYVHGKHLQTKADAGAFGGGVSWQFPCAADIDANIDTQARLYAGPNNPQVGKVPNANIHTVLNGSDWYDDDSNPAPTSATSPAQRVDLRLQVLDVKVTEDNSFPLASLIPLFPDIKRRARVESERPRASRDSAHRRPASEARERSGGLLQRVDGADLRRQVLLRGSCGVRRPSGGLGRVDDTRRCEPSMRVVGDRQRRREDRASSSRRACGPRAAGALRREPHRVSRIRAGSDSPLNTSAARRPGPCMLGRDRLRLDAERPVRRPVHPRLWNPAGNGNGPPTIESVHFSGAPASCGGAYFNSIPSTCAGTTTHRRGEPGTLIGHVPEHVAASTRRGQRAAGEGREVVLHVGTVRRYRPVRRLPGRVPAHAVERRMRPGSSRSPRVGEPRRSSPPTRRPTGSDPGAGSQHDQPQHPARNCPNFNQRLPLPLHRQGRVNANQADSCR